MPNKSEEQRKRQFDAFIDNWNWDKVFQTWRSRLDDFNIEPAPLFQVVNVHDPYHPEGRLSQIAWWPTESIMSNHMACQRNLDKFTGSGYLNPDWTQYSSGVRTSIEHLWENKSDLETVAAILIVGSLFPRMESSRSHYPDFWPRYKDVKFLAELAYSRWEGSERYGVWHRSCTTVFPWMNDDWESHSKIDSMGAMIRYLAEEHASLLLKYRAVEIKFGTKRDLIIGSALHNESEAEQQRHVEWQRQRREADAAEKQRVEALKLNHPRYGEWDTISKLELEKLVWSKSFVQLAADFGVSDVTIGKRCKSDRLEKPPKGFWEKVGAGIIPHPEGKKQVFPA